MTLQYSRADNIPQFFQIVGSKVRVIAVTSLDIFVDTMDVNGNCFDEFGLKLISVACFVQKILSTAIADSNVSLTCN